MPAINTDGTVRRGAQVVELVGYDPGPGWPTGARLICRRELPHPGASLSLFDQINGYRHTLMFTNTAGDVARVELAHRHHARVEDRIRCWKALGAKHLPSWEAATNEAWLTLTLVAATLIAWTQHLGFDGELAKAEPATFRTRVLHVAGQSATRGRCTYLHLDRAWPWTPQITHAYQRIRCAFTSP